MYRNLKILLASIALLLPLVGSAEAVDAIQCKEGIRVSTKGAASRTIPSLHTLNLKFQTSDGQPLTGGRVAWASDGFRSASPLGVTSNGTVKFEKVVSGPGIIFATYLLPVNESGNATKSFTFHCFVDLSQDSITLVFGRSKTTKVIKFELPNGLPVINSPVAVKGISGVENGVTNDKGELTISYYEDEQLTLGWESNIRLEMSFNDGVVVQKRSFPITDGIKVVVDQMPWTELSQKTVTVAKCALVKVVVRVKGVDTKAGLVARLIAPDYDNFDWKGECPKKVRSKTILTTKTDSDGKATFVACACVSHTFRVESAGAISTSNFTLRVKGAPPAVVQSVSARTLDHGVAQISWSAPAYTGGGAIKSYKVSVSTLSERKRVLLSKKVTSRTVSFTGLKNTTWYYFCVTSTTKFGTSQSSCAAVQVA